MSMVIIGTTFWEKRLDARPSCSVREYIEGHGTDREVMKTHDVKCEDNVIAHGTTTNYGR